jgi:type 1 glutamine amidotransferase
MKQAPVALSAEVNRRSRTSSLSFGRRRFKTREESALGKRVGRERRFLQDSLIERRSRGENITTTCESAVGQAGSCGTGILFLGLKICLLLVLSVASRSNLIASPTQSLTDAGWIPLFNGKNLDGWYTWLPSTGRDNDPKGVFKVEDGVLHILDLPETDQEQEFGYIATSNEYSNYRLRFQYRWGSKRFTPRAHDPRDSGLLYHFTGPDRIWPASVECQVQEGDTGDFYVIAGTALTTTVEPSDIETKKYKADGVAYDTRPAFDRIARSGTSDSLTDWNTVEVIVAADTVVHLVNGVANNRATRIRQPDPSNPSRFISLSRGRILFQAEGAEVFYRNIELKPLPTDADPFYKVLVFSKTEGFRHGSIVDGVAAINNLGTLNNFMVDATEDASVFNDARLSDYRAVVFLSTTGDVLDDGQQAAFEHYIRAGHGYAGVHSATDTEYGWPWYGALVGAHFSGHPAVQMAAIRLEDRAHVSTAALPDPWVRVDEWYDFRTNPRGNVRVLASLDESSYTGGTMGDHPIIWHHDFDGGRAWYTAGGHTSESYSEPLFLQHLAGGIQYAAGIRRGRMLDRTGWIVAAAPGDGATYAIDGDGTTRWTTGIPQTKGQFFQIDLGAAQSFATIVLDSGNNGFENDHPRGYEVYVSSNGEVWSGPVANGAGNSPLTEVTFIAQTARYIRIVQTGSDPGYWWTIHEVNLYQPVPPPRTN